jgi:putative ABC transport system substrate-binding protein
VEAANKLGREIIVTEARSNRDFEAAFANLVSKNVHALFAGNQPLLTVNRDKLVELAARHRLPAIYHVREFVQNGGLSSYGASIANTYRLGGVYVGQILKGAMPADLPVQFPTKFELVINFTTAKMLGLTIPLTLHVAADEIID